jgi:hypothetical protein
MAWRRAQVSAFVTAAQVTFLLLHDGRNDDTVKLFFRDVYEVRFTPALWPLLRRVTCSQTCSSVSAAQVYLRVVLNPFFSASARLTSPTFAQKVRNISRTYFRS